MSDIIIGKAKVVGVNEVHIRKNSEETTTSSGILLPKSSMPTEIKTVIASQLNILPPDGVTPDGFTNVHGAMTIPGTLPFGETYDLVLRVRTGTIDQPTGRMFQETV